MPIEQIPKIQDGDVEHCVETGYPIIPIGISSGVSIAEVFQLRPEVLAGEGNLITCWGNILDGVTGGEIDDNTRQMIFEGDPDKECARLTRAWAEDDGRIMGVFKPSGPMKEKFENLLSTGDSFNIGVRQALTQGWSDIFGASPGNEKGIFLGCDIITGEKQ